MVKQISIFSENKLGAMSDITGVLSDNEINIDAIITNDSAEYGIVRFVVDKPDEAVELFKEAGYMVKTTNVVGVYMEDEPGTLHKLLSQIKEANINLDYIYVTFDRTNASPIAIVKGDKDNNAIIENILENKGYTIRKS